MQEEKAGKRGSGNTFFIIVILLVCVVVFCLLKGNAPAIFGYRILHVVSSSMEPMLEEGCYIIIKETSVAKLQEGDVITFISEEPAIYGMYNTHRIYDIFEDTYTGERLFITKGDAYEEPDDYPVEADQIVGKLVKVLPLGKTIGKMMTYLSNNNVYFVVVILPLVICLISYLVQFFRVLLGKEEE